MDCDVIVVGGGLAGTRAAERLAHRGVSVKLLEARDRLGGRTWTRRLRGAPIDVGAQFIGPGQPRMYALVERFGLHLSPTPTAGRHLLEVDGGVRAYSGTIPFWNPLKLLKIHFNLSRLERLSRRVSVEGPWDSRASSALDAMTLADWQRRHAFRGRDIEALGESVLRSVLGVETDEISLLNFLCFISSNGGLMPLVETHGGFQQDRIVGGTQQVAEQLAAVLPNGSVHLSEPVLRIRQDDASIAVDTTQRSYRAQRAIVGVPLAVAGRIEYEPALAVGRQDLQRDVVMGNTVKIFVAYARPFWREAGLSGQAVGTSGWLSVVFDNTSYDGQVYGLLGLVVGRAARSFVEMPLAQRRSAVIDELVHFFGPDASQAIEYEDTDWSSEPFSGGCPTGLFGVETLSRHGDSLRRPVGRIHWAGTETARQCIGYMEGAVESGERAAEEVLFTLDNPGAGAQRLVD